MHLLVPSWKGHMVSDLSEIPGEEKLSQMESNSLFWRSLQIWTSREVGEPAVALHNDQELLLAPEVKKKSAFTWHQPSWTDWEVTTITMISKPKSLQNATLKLHSDICPYYGIPSFTSEIYFSLFWRSTSQRNVWSKAADTNCQIYLSLR